MSEIRFRIVKEKDENVEEYGAVYMCDVCGTPCYITCKYDSGEDLSDTYGCPTMWPCKWRKLGQEPKIIPSHYLRDDGAWTAHPNCRYSGERERESKVTIS